VTQINTWSSENVSRGPHLLHEIVFEQQTYEYDYILLSVSAGVLNFGRNTYYWQVTVQDSNERVYHVLAHSCGSRVWNWVVPNLVQYKALILPNLQPVRSEVFTARWWDIGCGFVICDTVHCCKWLPVFIFRLATPGDSRATLLRNVCNRFTGIRGVTDHKTVVQIY
jgi:hypothetical protein